MDRSLRFFVAVNCSDMKLGTLSDPDVFKNPEHDTPQEYRGRQAVKIIIKNNNSEIALVTNPIHRLFLLPGGGAESDDLYNETKREALEETNHNIEIIEKIAEIEEFRNRNAVHYLTTCFLAKALEKSYGDLRTKEEIENGLAVKWFNLDEAMEIMSEQVDRVEKREIEFYNTAFNVIRDFKFVELIKEN